MLNVQLKQRLHHETTLTWTCVDFQNQIPTATTSTLGWVAQFIYSFSHNYSSVEQWFCLKRYLLLEGPSSCLLTWVWEAREHIMTYPPALFQNFGAHLFINFSQLDLWNMSSVTKENEGLKTSCCVCLCLQNQGYMMIYDIHIITATMISLSSKMPWILDPMSLHFYTAFGVGRLLLIDLSLMFWTDFCSASSFWLKGSQWVSQKKWRNDII